MDQDKSQLEPEELIKAFEEVDVMLERIKAKEADVINRVFLRFCLLKGKEINYDHVKRKLSPTPNYWTYYWMYGTPMQYFLMSRELVVSVIDGKPQYKLNIKFNQELLIEKEGA